jgi:cell volume regulation protein A
MPDIGHLVLAASALLLLAVFAGRVAGRIGIPPLLLFLLIGMLAGSDGPGGIYFDDAWATQLIGTLALALILFAGGLETSWPRVRPALWPAMALSTVGVLVTAALVAWFATIALGFSWLEGLLLGAIVSATDAAAVFAVIGGGALRLRGRLLPILELESGTNDPMAVFLTIGMTELLTHPHTSPASLLVLFVQQMGIGAALGLGLGLGVARLIHALQLEAGGLAPVLMTALALFAFGLTATLGGSGFLAVYLVGLVAGNGAAGALPRIGGFQAGLATLAEIIMFLTLGLLVFPSRLLPIAGVGLLLTLCLTVVARPVSVFVGLAFSSLGVREKVFIAWVGLRGAVPIVLATFPLLAGVARAGELFDVVFFVVLASVLLQGTTINVAARWLGVAAPFASAATRAPGGPVAAGDGPR